MNVCIPTLNAVDEFWKCVESINSSSIKCNIYVVDNGQYLAGIKNYPMFIYTPQQNLGVAGSWNWFVDNVNGDKIIVNDDIVFDKYAIELMYKTNIHDGSNLVCPENLSTPFSCFLLPQHVVNVVGRFDEWISPRYAYFEDDDYSYRMSLAGIGITKAENSLVQHAGSSTLKHFDKMKEREHHEKFRLARDHYKKKWGGEPGQEQFTTPFNR